MLSKRIINRELGVNPLYRRKTNWIAAAIGAAASIASSLFGASKAKKARKKAEAEQKRRANEEQAWYDRRYNEDYADTAAGQNLLRQANEYADKQWRKAEGAKAVGGATDAATAEAKESANKMVGNTIANIAAADTARKDRVDTQHQANLSSDSKQTQARYMQQASDINTAAQNASNAMMSAGVAIEGGMNKNTSKLTGQQVDDISNGTVNKINPVSNDGIVHTPQTTDLTGKTQTSLGAVPQNADTEDKLWNQFYEI